MTLNESSFSALAPATVTSLHIAIVPLPGPDPVIQD